MNYAGCSYKKNTCLKPVTVVLGNVVEAIIVHGVYTVMTAGTLESFFFLLLGLAAGTVMNMLLLSAFIYLSRPWHVCVPDGDAKRRKIHTSERFCARGRSRRKRAWFDVRNTALTVRYLASTRRSPV